MKQCLDSLRLQSLRQIEVLLVDNGSAEDAEAALAYISSHGLAPHWQVLHSPTNNGPGDARNRGLAAAQGEYVAFVDGDDWVEQDMYRFLYDAATIGHQPYDIASSAALKEFPDGRQQLMLNPRVGSGEITTAKRKTLLRHFISNFTTMIFRRRWLNQYHIRFPETFGAEDSAFMGMCYLTASTLAQCDIPFYHYRQHPASVSHSTLFSRSKHKRQALSELLLFAKTHNLLRPYAPVLYLIYLKKAILTPLREMISLR